MDSEKYWAKIDALASSVRFHRTLLVVLTVLIIVLVWTVKRLATEPPTVIVVPGATSKMVIRPGAGLPDEIVKDLALYIVNTYATFTPSTYDKSVDQILKFVAPEAYSEIRTQLYKLGEQIKKSGYTQTFFPVRVDVIRAGNSIQAVIYGNQQVILSGRVVSQEEGQYVIKFKEVVPNEENPYGLVITRLSFTSASQ